MKKTYSILIRYLILLALMFSLPLIYKIITPLTLYTILGILKLFFKEVLLQGNIISIEFKTFLEIIPQCIAGSAYLLLLILNLTVPMKSKKRFYSILTSFLLLFALNILRIFTLTLLQINNSSFFNITHKLFWYILSTVFVVGIWFLIVRLYSVKEIPVYTDIKYLLKQSKRKTKR